MSKLEELIQELCPDGVEYKTIGDIATITRGRVMSKDYIKENQGEYPVYSSQTENNGEFGRISTYDFDGEFLTWTTDGANAGSVFYRNSKFSVTNVCGLIKVSDGMILPRFLYFVLSVEAKRYVNSGMGNPKLMSNVMAKIKVPIPPLPVQQEIVRILDNFTELTAELQEKLTAELTARKKQYEYYRDRLLSFDQNDMGRFVGTQLGDLIQESCLDGVEFKHFGKMATIVRGASPRPIKNFITTDVDGVNWIKIGDVKPGSKYITETAEKITPDGAKKSRFVKEDDFILSNSMSFGRPYIMKTQGCIHDGWLAISNFENYFIPDFLYHLLNSNMYQQEMRKKASFGGAVQNLNADIVRDLKMPVVPLPVQREIVRILDRFDTLCNNLTNGLPSEIEARQKQYKYYRDKLLTFKELEV